VKAEPHPGEIEFVPAVPPGSFLGRPWRRFMRRLKGWPNLEGLQQAGLHLGRNVFVAGGTHLDPDFCWLIDVGDDTVISLGVMVLAHDASTRRHVGYTRVARVRIGSRVFIGAHAIVLPGVTVGDDAIVGAGSVVRHDVPAGTVVAGNPAEVINDTADYADRHREMLAERPCWPRRGWTVGGGITKANKRAMREALRDGEAYVE
jgi:maltose O-acetyltransferase